MSLLLRWFFSPHVRRAIELRRHVLRVLRAQQDILTPEAVAAVLQAARQLDEALRKNTDAAAVGACVEQLTVVAGENLQRARYPVGQENIEVLLVALVVVLALQTFFLQLMKIPSASAQPTLYGVTYQDWKHDRQYQDEKVPGLVTRMIESCLFGVSYYEVIAKADGELRAIEPPKQVFPFVTRQRLLVGDVWYTVWFPAEQLLAYAGLRRERSRDIKKQFFRRGETIIKIKVTSGDRLLVDRFSYNFVRPKRGEIIVFKSDGIRRLEQGTYYIKRLVGLGGDHVRIGNDRHLVINGTRLDASTPHFENIYTFYGPPQESHYSGHVNEFVAHRYGLSPGLAPLFPDADREYAVPPHRYLVMGDNTLNSYDSRAWGDFPEKNVIGKFFFVYWPLSSRFGWGAR
ncbi:MAG: signal peptidase I [Limisphaerales bacterium]